MVGIAVGKDVGVRDAEAVGEAVGGWLTACNTWVGAAVSTGDPSIKYEKLHPVTVNKQHSAHKIGYRNADADRGNRGVSTNRHQAKVVPRNA